MLGTLRLTKASIIACHEEYAMRITILGAGHIGGTLGRNWALAGHEIEYGVRDPLKPRVQELVQSLGGRASVASIVEVIGFGEVVVFAIPGFAMDETISANARLLDGKIIVDAANNMGAPSMNSLATFAAQTPDARVYRAFNSYGWEVFDNPIFQDTQADLFYCGPEGESRARVERLISDVGLNPIYVGGPEQVEVVDSVLKLWFTLVRGRNMGRNIAFKVLRR